MDKELEHFILGKKLGFGIHRDVYEYKLDTTCVIKIANDDETRAQNIIEMKIWQEIEWSDFKKWFAPCVVVSEGGKYLIQKKIEIQENPKNYPAKIPHFFTDIKPDNFGWLGRRFVCCDYSLLIITNGITKKMKNVKWLK